MHTSSHPTRAASGLAIAAALGLAFGLAACADLRGRFPGQGQPGAGTGRDGPSPTSSAGMPASPAPPSPAPTAPAEATASASPEPTPTATPISYRIASDSIVTTLAGGGAAAATSDVDPQGIGDGGAPAAAVLARPSHVVVAPDGALFVLEYTGDRVREISGGTIRTFAGTGALVASDSPVPARALSLARPKCLTVTPAGDVIVLDSRVVAGEPTGALLAVARSSGRRYGKDLVPGQAVPLYVPEATPSPFPGDLAAGPSGDLYLTDGTGNRLWKLDITGVFSVVAGTGTLATATGSASGDGGPATEANLALIKAVAVDPWGNVFLSEGSPYRIRMLCTQTGRHFGLDMVAGNFYPVAGAGPRTANTGAGADVGDLGQASNPDGDALRATFWGQGAMAFDPAGNLFVCDTGNHRIRRIDRLTRVITTVAGSGAKTATAAPMGDGGPAGLATFKNPAGLAFTPSGALLVADDQNLRVRAIAPIQ